MYVGSVNLSVQKDGSSYVYRNAGVRMQLVYIRYISIGHVLRIHVSYILLWL